MSPLNGIPVFFDLTSGIKCAERCDKPILLWFTGWACVSSRKMEEQIFVDKRNFKKLRDGFVIVCLYVDDRTKLPKTEFETWNFKGREREVKTIGNKNSKYQIEQFNNNSQPLFIILSSNGEEVIDQFGYLPNVSKVDSILTSGIKKYKTNTNRK